jgi:DNA-binding NarL/FixJ family response regulator
VISVLIVDDHPVVRQGLRALLEVQDDMAVAGEAGDGPAAISLAESLRPDIVLLDLKLPGMDGVAVLRPLRAAGLRVLVLTSATEPSTAAAAVRAGAAGVVYKDIDPAALVRAIRSVHDGNVLLAPEAVGSLVRGSRAGGARRDRGRQVQQGDRAAAAGLGEDGEGARERGPRQARRAGQDPGGGVRGAARQGVARRTVKADS